MYRNIVTIEGGNIRIAFCNGDHIVVAKYFYIDSLGDPTL